MNFKVGDEISTKEFGFGRIVCVNKKNKTIKYIPYNKKINLLFVVADFDEIYSKTTISDTEKQDDTDFFVILLAFLVIIYQIEISTFMNKEK